MNRCPHIKFQLLFTVRCNKPTPNPYCKQHTRKHMVKPKIYEIISQEQAEEIVRAEDKAMGIVGENMPYEKSEFQG